MKRSVALASVLSIAGLVNLTSTLRAADTPVKKKPVPDLAAALKATPGCLGVETAQTSSGKHVIFAWFEDKKAALKWYYSDVHRDLMQQFFPDFKREGKPLADVPDDSGPIMAIASLTFKAKPSADDPLPYKQIAIELYQPLGNGISIGGKFSPDKMKVSPRKDQSDK
jgi:hypothetical protein